MMLQTDGRRSERAGQTAREPGQLTYFQPPKAESMGEGSGDWMGVGGSREIPFSEQTADATAVSAHLLFPRSVCLHKKRQVFQRELGPTWREPPL